MGNLSQLLLTVAAVIGALTVVGAGLALVRGSYSKARIIALREDNEDLRNRLDDHEDRIQEQMVKEEALESKVAYLTSENALLTEKVTQRADVQTVLVELREHHETAMLRMDALIAAVHALGGERG